MDELVGGTRLTEVDTPWVGELSTKLRGRGIGASTVNRYLAVLSKVMKLASQWGWVTGVPYMPRGKEGSHRIRVVTEVEEKQLLQHFHAHHTGMLALTSFLLDTGCRLGEALAITTIDRQKALQAGRWTIWVNKGDRPRTVPLTTRARHALAHWGWEGMSARQCQAAWDKARTAMGLKEDKGFVIHALRHTCATRLVDKDVPLTVIRDYLGHSTVAVTERYAHLNPRALEAAALCLETVTTGEYDASVLVCDEIDVVAGTRVLPKGYVARAAQLRLGDGGRLDCKSDGSAFGGSNPPPSTNNLEDNSQRELKKV